MLFQHGSGLRPQKRRTSWYDVSIVCKEGEQILSEIDDLGIKLLRKEKLVWSGFGPLRRIEPDIFIDNAGEALRDYGLRKVSLENVVALRKFFLSLLWRASVSNLPEMRDVKLEKVDEDALTSYLRGDTDLPLSFYPCWLTQHHEVGFIHNQTPTKGEKTFPGRDGSNPYTVLIYRFYFDGLVAHFHHSHPDDPYKFAKNSLTVGAQSELYVACVPWKRSRQLENLVGIARGSQR
jgi:hypothetical protein